MSGDNPFGIFGDNNPFLKTVTSLTAGSIEALANLVPKNPPIETQKQLPQISNAPANTNQVSTEKNSSVLAKQNPNQIALTDDGKRSVEQLKEIYENLAMAASDQAKKALNARLTEVATQIVETRQKLTKEAQNAELELKKVSSSVSEEAIKGFKKASSITQEVSQELDKFGQETSDNITKAQEEFNQGVKELQKNIINISADARGVFGILTKEENEARRQARLAKREAERAEAAKAEAAEQAKIQALRKHLENNSVPDPSNDSPTAEPKANYFSGLLKATSMMACGGAKLAGKYVAKPIAIGTVALVGGAILAVPFLVGCLAQQAYIWYKDEGREERIQKQKERREEKEREEYELKVTANLDKRMEEYFQTRKITTEPIYSRNEERKQRHADKWQRLYKHCAEIDKAEADRKHRKRINSYRNRWSSLEGIRFLFEDESESELTFRGAASSLSSGAGSAWRGLKGLKENISTVSKGAHDLVSEGASVKKSYEDAKRVFKNMPSGVGGPDSTIWGMEGGRPSSTINPLTAVGSGIGSAIKSMRENRGSSEGSRIKSASLMWSK
jgi:hypothetical protein